MKTKESGIQKTVGKKGSYYRVQIRMKGTRHLSKSFDSYLKAKEWKTKTASAIKSGLPYETTEMRRTTVGDLIDRFEKHELHNYRNIKTMQGHLNWWKEEIGHCTLNLFREDLIARCRDALKEKGLAFSSVNRYLATLSTVISIAIREWRILNSSPLKNIRKLTEPNGRERILTKEERIRLLQACKQSSYEYLYPIVLMALCTGMRKSEITSLKWKDIDIAQNKLVLHHTKNGDRRVIPIKGPVLEELQKLDIQRKQKQKQHEFVFAGPRGKPINFRKHWVNALNKASINDFHFHDNRHDCISMLGELGYPLHVISKIVGHRSHVITATRYSHLEMEHAEDAMKCLGDVMENDISKYFKKNNEEIKT